MRNINKTLIAVSMVILTAGTGCKKEWYDINKEPNNPVESNISPDLVLPNALLNTANRAGTGFGFLNNWMGYWAPAANYSPNVEEQAYQITTNFGAGLFGGIYDNNYDYQFMENKAVETGQDMYAGIAKIMKAHNFAVLVDLYNDVPYTESLKKLEYIRPSYESGQAIYEDLVKVIDTGVNLIKNADAAKSFNIEKTDIMFHGDQDLWVRFGNTLKLRLLMHQANRADRQGYIQGEIAKITGGYLGSGESAAVNPGYTSDKPNVYYASYGFTQTGTIATDFWRANVVALNYLKYNADPREGYFYKPIAGSLPGGFSEPFPTVGDVNYRGNQYGRPIDNSSYPYQTFNFVSQIGGDPEPGAMSGSSSGLIKGFNMDMWILTSVESMFLQAEAIRRGYIAGDAEAAYKDAIKESFIWLNVGGSHDAAVEAFDSWYADMDEADNSDVSYSDVANTDIAQLRLIMFQKYLALDGIAPLESWTDLRRYTGGQPQVDPEPDEYADGYVGNGAYPYIHLSVNPGRTSNILPVRLLYPQRELNLNLSNVPEVGRKSGDQFTGKIWWMP